MFESDDFDQVLSQFDLPEITSNDFENSIAEERCQPLHVDRLSPALTTSNGNKQRMPEVLNKNSKRSTYNDFHASLTIVSPKHMKRKLIDTHFDPKSIRKFPGPAGLLSGSFIEAKDETISDMELFSQDIDFSQNNLKTDSFELPLWNRLVDDLTSWNLSSIDSIKDVKQQAVAGNLQRKKAKAVAAFIERVDRSVIDPLITLRDTSGSIKCTLHRDAWSSFAPYLASEHCILVLLRPTVLTTGSAFKKHYLNITLSNIYAIYSSAVLTDEEKDLPDGYTKVTEETFTIIKSKSSPSTCDSEISFKETDTDTNKLLEGIDASLFSEDLF